jgi:hypothetical protein
LFGIDHSLSSLCAADDCASGAGGVALEQASEDPIASTPMTMNSLDDLVIIAPLR